MVVVASDWGWGAREEGGWPCTRGQVGWGGRLTGALVPERRNAVFAPCVPECPGIT